MGENSEASGDGKEYYPGTQHERPEQLTGGGRGDYCCVPECKNARYNYLHEKSQIGLFRFPTKDPSQMKRWEKVFKHIRRKGKMDKFDPSKRTTLVCEFHFPIRDIYVRANGRKELRPGSVPMLKERDTKSSRKPPKEIFNLVGGVERV